MAKAKVLVDRDNIFDSDNDSPVDDDNESHSSGEDDHVGDDDSHVDDDDDSHVDELDDDIDKPTQSQNQEEELSDSSSDVVNEASENSQAQDSEKSGMASVIARILSKDTSKSKRVLLAKGKTSQEILRDISERKQQREKSENVNVIRKRPREVKLNDVAKEEKRKIWEAMGRRIPSILDNPREVKLRKIATQGMVQLFRLVSQAKMQG